MDLQLYRVDEANYLVDFRNIGYYTASSGKDVAPEDVKSIPFTDDAEADPATGDAHAGAPVRPPTLKAAVNKDATPGQIGGVSGPFHFLEMACQLIAELASG